MTIRQIQDWAISQEAIHYLREITLPFPSLEAKSGLAALLEGDSPLSTRLAGCILFHPEVDIEKLLPQLRPGAKGRLRHIVACGRRVEDSEPFWARLERRVGSGLDDDLPHWSRFCTHGPKGYSYMGQHFVWLRPNPDGFKRLAHL